MSPFLMCPMSLFCSLFSARFCDVVENRQDPRRPRAAIHLGKADKINRVMVGLQEEDSEV